MPELKQTDNQIIDFIKNRYSLSEKAKTNDLGKFSRFYNLYRGVQTERNYKGLANLFVPEPHRIIQRKTAKIVQSIRGIKGKPEGQNDIESAKTWTILANYLNRKLSLKNFYRMLIKESRIVGISWAKITWEVLNEEEDKPWKGYKFDVFSVDRVFINPKKTMFDIMNGGLDYLIVEYERTLDELKLNPNYDEDTLSLMEKQNSGSSMKDTILSQARAMFSASKEVPKETKENKYFTIKEFWGKYDGEDRLIVVADDKFILRNDENPYAEVLDNPIPFVMFPASVEPFEISPIGDIEPNESLFNELNDTRNQRMDSVTFSIDPIKIIDRDANIKKSDLVIRRGAVIEADSVEAIKYVSPDMQGVRAAIDEEKIIRGDIQQSSGVIDFGQGSEVQSGLNMDTARGTLIAKSEADLLTEDEIDIVKESLKQFWRIMLAYSQTFLDKDFTVAIREGGTDQFHTINKESLQGNIDIDVEIKTLQDDTTEQQMAVVLFNQAKTVPGAKLGKFFVDLLETFKDDIKIEEYYEEPQPPAPEPPNVSISLKGDLTQLQSGQIFKTIPNVDPAFADPIMYREGRDMMAGILPETEEDVNKEKTKAETDKITSETVNNLQEDKTDNNERV